jgi:hypothetical protein
VQGNGSFELLLSYVLQKTFLKKKMKSVGKNEKCWLKNEKCWQK